MSIELVRLDDRLIHGQVVTSWTRTKGINAILAVDDKVAKDKFQIQLMKMATPPGVTAHFLTTQEAIDNILSDKYAGKKCMLLMKTAKTLYDLCNSELNLKDINVGNMRGKDAKIQLHNIVYVNEEDLKLFKELSNKGINLYAQAVVNDKACVLNEIINNK